MRKIILCLFIILFCFSISCITYKAYRYPGSGFMIPQLNPKQIQVLYLKPSVPFEIIGEVTAEGPAISTWRELENVMR